ncbi:tRNase Z TRZ1-like [Punica granatum]|uniref:TRNase Z TRZ1-like n=1 Tax=Punica granatum TaxID=22663 RepID=A0A6P8DZ25_PUNGR|nr:tRNase Z TRZ1-like [Punica granatum]
MHVESCGLFSLKPSTVIVPCSMKEDVDRLFTGHREMDGSDLKKFHFSFCCYPGYVVYSVKQKLKQDYAGLSGCGIWDLRLAGVEVTNTIMVPEIAFTGDNMSKFIVDSDNVDVLRAKILILESTFNNDTMTIEDAREYGHTHLLEIVRYADRFRNKCMLLIHFSARHKQEETEAAERRSHLFREESLHSQKVSHCTRPWEGIKLQGKF